MEAKFRICYPDYKVYPYLIVNWSQIEACARDPSIVLSILSADLNTCMETIAFADFDSDKRFLNSCLSDADTFQKLPKLLQLELQYLLHKQHMLDAEEHKLDAEIDRNRKFLESEDTDTCGTDRKPKDSDCIDEWKESEPLCEEEESSNGSEPDYSPMD